MPMPLVLEKNNKDHKQLSDELLRKIAQHIVKTVINDLLSTIVYTFIDLVLTFILKKIAQHIVKTHVILGEWSVDIVVVKQNYCRL